MAFTLTADQQVDVSLVITDAHGNPAPVDGTPTWEATDVTKVTLNPSPDGLSAVIAAKGPVGTSQVRVTADADLGAGVTNIIGLLDVQVVGGQATVIQLQPGTPGPKPAPL